MENSTKNLRVTVTALMVLLCMNVFAQTTPTFNVTQNTATLGQGSRLQQVLRVQLRTYARDRLSSISFRLIGRNNIQSVRLYNGQGTNTWYLWQNLYGNEISSLTSDTITFTATGNETYDLTNDVYLFLLVNVKPEATVGQLIDAECLNAVINKTWTLKPAAGNPAGARKIVAPLNGTYTIKGPSGPNNFTKLSAAIDTLNRWGYNGNVTFLLKDDSVFAENFSGKYIWQTSSVYTLTFKRSGDGTSMPVVRPTGTTSADDAGFTFWGTDNVVIDGIMIDGPTVGTNFVEYGIRLRNAKDDGCQQVTIRNCVIQLDSLYDSRCIYTTRQVPLISTDGNFNKLKILNNVVRNARWGIRLDNGNYSPFQEDSVYIIGNTVSNLAINSDNSGIYARDVKNLIVASNEVKDIRLGTNYQNWIRGIDVAATNLYVIANKVHGITNPGNNNNSRAIGIIAYGQNNYVINNMVWDVNVTGATTVGAGGEVVRGISVQGYNNIGYCYVYNNSVFLNTVTNPTNGQWVSAIHVENNITWCELKNNIAINRSTGAAAMKNMALYYNIDNVRTYSLESNNNLFYAGAPSAVNLIARMNGNDRQTLLLYKQNMQGADMQSVSDSVHFTGGDLHIDNSFATVVEGNGLPIPLVTTDIDGEPRDPLHPDIGADEGNFGVAIDTVGPIIKHVPMQDTTSLLPPTLVVEITDISKVDTTLNKPRVWYRKTTNGTTFGANNSSFNGWKWVEPSNNSSPFIFTLDYSLLNGGAPTAGTTIEYFIMAQDYHVNPNLSLVPSNGAYTATTVSNISAITIGNRYRYKILSATPYSGDIHVGAAQAAPFNSLPSAANALNNGWINGPVRLLLDDPVYNLGTTTVTFNEIKGASRVNTITIKPNTGTTVTISYAPNGNNSAAIVLNGSDYFIIDGSNTDGGTSRDLTIQTTTNYSGAVINVRSLGTGKGARCNTIKNCIICGPFGLTYDLYGIASGGTPISQGDDNDSLIIENNLIYRLRMGIYVKGNQTGVHDYVRIVGNTLDSLTCYGMEIQRVQDLLIERNVIKNVLTGGDGNDRAAINIQTSVTNAVISRNIIDNITKIPNINNRITGIAVDPGHQNAGITIVNNMITRVLGEHSTGIYLNNIGNFSVKHNTVYLTGDVSAFKPAQNTYHSCLRLESDNIRNGTILNNIFVNNIKTYDTLVGGNTYYNTYNIYINTTAALSPTLTCNYNVFWYSNQGPVNNSGYTGRYNNTNRRRLNDWITQVGVDVNSLRDSVKFVDVADAHLNPAYSTKAESAGTDAGITVDIDGEARSSTPDIGADEGNFIPAASVKTSVVSVSPYQVPIYNPSATVMLQAKDASGNNVTTGGEKVSFSIKDLTGYSLATIGAVYDSLNGRYTAPLTATRVGNPVWITALIGDVAADDTGTFVVTNTTPSDIMLSKTRVNEGSWTNKFVARLFTTDPDASQGDKYTYSLVTGTGSTDNAYFTISNDSLFITANVAYATKASYAIRIQTRDIGNATFQKAFTISVNAAPTNITLPVSVVNDSTPAGTLLGNLSATDPNGGGETFTYQLVPGPGDTNNIAFHITGNQLYIDSMPVYASTKTLYLRIQVMDQDSLTYQKAFAIPVNTRPTNIYLSPQSIAEAQPKFSLVGTLNAEDPNGDGLTYSLNSSLADNAKFGITGGNKLITNEIFDYETQKFYTVVIRGTDPGGLYIEKQFVITITDVYEPPTDITLSSQEVIENKPAGTVVGRFTCNDPDSGDVVIYSLVTGTGSTDNASFKISGDSLLTNAIFDYETKKTYSIRVRATDKGNKSFDKVFTISVVDENETGITKALSEVAALYPVPCHGILNIRYKATGKPVLTVSDLLGREVYNGTITSDNTVLDLNHVAKGMYILKITDNGNVYTGTILIE